MLIIPDYDAQALSAPQSFRDGVQTAINILDAEFTANITVKIAVGYGEAGVFGALPNQNTSLGGFTLATNISYTALRNDLIAASDVNSTSTSLPNASSVNGKSSFVISSTQERLFGLLPAINNTSNDDGQIGMGTTFTGNVLIAGALHELTHALGRTNASSLDIFRFTSQGNRLFTGGSTSVPAYFSMDNGVTDFADFGQNSDPGDFLNPPNSNRTPNDPFNENVGNMPNLTATDILIMDALGFRHAPPGNPPPPAGTTADMILRHGSDGLYEIYDIGHTAILAAYQLGQVGTDWKFVGLGGFFGNDTTDMILRNATGGFEVYDISNNKITGAAFLGTVGMDWQVMGFGNFGSFGETDMILRNANTGGIEVYNIRNNQITGAAFMGTVGLDWQVAGFGNFSSRGTSDMILRNTNTGGLEVYDINSNQITGAAFMGTVGLDWKVLGFGNFSSRGTSDMIMRNTTTGGLEIYDINSNQVTSAYFIGNVGLDWQFAGIGPIHAAGASDLVLRNSGTGAFEVYTIANNQLTGAALLGTVGLDWQLGGFAVDPPTGSDGATSQLVQAMAGFSGSASFAQGPLTQAVHGGESQPSLFAVPSLPHAA